MKHIEQIQPEYAAGDLSRLLVSEPDATASAALSRLLHNVTGCAIPPTADTPQSEVEELVPLCLSILRRHWTTPLTALGDGTTPMSLADLMRRLIGDRVDGNEALGIPPANANIPTAVAALRQRDISSGLTLTLTDGTDGSTDGSTPTTTSLPDGLSLAQLLCSGLADNITELQDNNKGWTMTQRIADSANLYPFPYLRKVTLNCVSVKYAPILVRGYDGSNNYLEELHFPSLTEIGALFANNGVSGAWHNGTLKLHTITMPNVARLISYADSGGYYYQSLGLFSAGCPSLLHFELPNLEIMDIAMCGGDSLKNIQSIRLPKLKRMNAAFYSTYNKTTDPLPNLILLEIGEVETKIDLSMWTATTALSERLPEFLSNFKTYIAHRLTANGSGLTLTLSPAVRDAIQQDPEIVSIITSKGWTISPAPSV